MQNTKQTAWHVEKAPTITTETKIKPLEHDIILLEIDPFKFIHTAFKIENAVNTLHRAGV